ncbi:GH25 family lysozyme [Lactobacillus gasseri]|uniref:GH25 family lysozyme n=1 Tax=Lactobacillus gasseri TaxID=1596 RepID=UPI00344B90EC
MEVAKRSYGVDVSDWQASNLSAMASAGSKYAVVKVSEGLNYQNPKAQAQINSAKQNNMMPMGYHYANFSNNSNIASQEGDYAVNSAQQAGLPQGSYLAADWETGSGNVTNRNAADNTSAILTFMNVVARAGYKPLLYSGKYLMSNNMNVTKITSAYSNSLWVAAYPMGNGVPVSEPNFNYFPSMNDVIIWQFTDNWKNLNVDGNINLLELEDNTAVSQPVTTPQSNNWVDNLGDKWIKENGTFITDRPINLRKGAKLTSDIITTLPAGSVVKYNAYSRHDGYVWIRQPRVNGQYGYMVCRQGNTPWGTFK